MRRTMLGSAILAAVAAQSAYAGDAAALEPGLRFAWHFGAAHAESAPSLSLGLYPNDLGWRRLWADAGVEEAARLERPAVLDLHVGSDPGLRLMGLSLSTQALGLNADQRESNGGSFLKPVLIVLAAGVATALVISSAGDAAEDNNPSVNVTGSGNDGGGDDDDGSEGGTGCVNGECVLPCGGTGPVNSCGGG